jgi:hypothetical protein
MSSNWKGIVALTSPLLQTFRVDLAELFEGKQEGFLTLARAPHEMSLSLYTSKITGLVRTPDGRGLAVRRRDGGEVYSLTGSSLTLNHRWSGDRDVVVLNKGQLYPMR